MREFTASIAFISFITLLLLSVKLYLENSRKTEHILFNLFSTILSLICFSEFMAHLSGSLNDALFWARTASLWPLASGIFLHFVLKITCRNTKAVNLLVPVVYAGSFTMIVLYNFFINKGHAVHELAGYSLRTPTSVTFPEFLVVPMQNLYLLAAFGLLLWRSVSSKKSSYPVPQTRWIFLAFSMLLAATVLSSVGTVFLSMPEIISLPYLFFAGGIFLGIKNGHLIILTPKTTLEHVLTRLQEMVILTSPNGGILSVNMAAEEFFGVKNETVPGKSVQQLLKNEPHDGDIKITDAGGRVRWVKISTSKVHDRKGKKSGTVYVIRDITREKMHTQSLQQSIREKEVLLHEVHHRVNNSLQTVVSLLNLKSDSMETIKDQRILQLCGNRVSLISFIYELAYSREDLSNIPLQRVLEELSNDLYQHHKNRDDIKIMLDLEQIYIDLQRAIPIALIITEIFSNVFEHAYTPQKKGTLCILLKEEKIQGEESSVIIQVQDKGKGFNTEAAAFQGLALAEALCRQISAELLIESGDEGTTVTIKIPGGTAG